MLARFCPDFVLEHDGSISKLESTKRNDANARE